MSEQPTPPEPTHQPGTSSGERMIEEEGREPGRTAAVKQPEGGDEPVRSRTPRDATGVNAEGQGPIDPDMPHMPPP